MKKLALIGLIGLFLNGASLSAAAAHPRERFNVEDLRALLVKNINQSELSNQRKQAFLQLAKQAKNNMEVEDVLRDLMHEKHVAAGGEPYL